MADREESFNFGIEATFDTGMGNPQLLDDLLSPETSTAEVADLKTIGEETSGDDISKKPDKVKKEIMTSKETEDDQISGEELLDQFLTTTDEEEEEEEEIASDVKKDPPKKKEVEDEQQEGVDFSALSKDLFTLGVFQKGEEEEEISISSPEEFLERFNLEKKKGAADWLDGFLGQFGEDYQQAFDAIFVKGVNPKEYFGAYNNIVDFSDLDLEREENQEKVMKQSLLDQGWEGEDVTDEIQRLKDIGDLKRVSERHHKVLVKKEATKLKDLEENSKRQLQQKAEIKKQYTDNVQRILSEKIKEKEFDGIPINAKFANELQDFLLVDKWKTVSGETLTDFDRAILELKKPENHNMKVKMAALYKLLEKDPTLSTIQRSGLSKKSNQIFNEIARQTSKQSPSGLKKENRSYFNNL